jgi:hypothetical protein
VRADADGHLSAQYGVRLELSAGGESVVGGFGLNGDYVAGAGPTITFGVRADTFFVGAPTGSGLTEDLVPFVIKTTTWDDNGVSRDPGVYIKGAFIENLVAAYATIRSLVADDITTADINAAQILAGSLRVGSYLQSTNYSPGTAGWRITADGVIEGYSATLRGTITATAGEIGGLVIGASDIRSGNYVFGSAGFKLNSNGTMEIAELWARGDIEATSLNAATGTFTGALVAATGTFEGTTTVGAAPAISGTTMTGSGFVAYDDGRVAFGNSTKNVTFNGTQLTVNGDFVTTGNLVANAVTKTYGITYTAPTGTGPGIQTEVVAGLAAGSSILVHSGGVVSGPSLGGIATIQLQRYEGSDDSDKVNLTVLFGPIDVLDNAVFSFPPYVDVVAASGTYTYEIWKTAGSGLGPRTIALQECKR